VPTQAMPCHAGFSERMHQTPNTLLRKCSHAPRLSGRRWAHASTEHKNARPPTKETGRCCLWHDGSAGQSATQAESLRCTCFLPTRVEVDLPVEDGVISSHDSGPALGPHGQVRCIAQIGVLMPAPVGQRVDIPIRRMDDESVTSTRKVRTEGTQSHSVRSEPSFCR
jgi:hypothetical protein